MKKQFQGKLYLSVNYFVSKPGTVFAQELFERKTLKEQEKIFSQTLTSFKVKMPKLSTSYKEWVILQD